MTRVRLGDRLGARRHAVAGEDLDALDGAQLLRVGAELTGEVLVEGEQVRVGDGDRVDPGAEPAEVADEAVVPLHVLQRRTQAPGGAPPARG